ncbi:hypothetical protein HY969_00870 [Candidatus Kaiserbacteria bacterium]|nr:hypothetical protein [Candidatus Kaiserbacteria bacterium]
MGKRGPKPKRIVSEKWSSNLAYAVGLLATDGCMSPRVHLIDLTSKDLEQLENFCKCIGVQLNIGRKSSGFGEKNILRVQMKNVFFYNFLLSIGLTPAKSRTLGPLKVPKKYFFDFLRGVFDGDGCTYSYWDPRWRSSFMYYLCFASASTLFVTWIRKEIQARLGVTGHVTSATKKNTYYNLKYAKHDSLKILRKMYSTSPSPIYLSRKRLKIEQMLRIVGQRL